MAAVGRGRGRGRGISSLSKEVRPGEAAGDKAVIETKDPVDELTRLVAGLDVDPDKAQIEPIKSAAEKAAKDKNTLENVVSVLYKHIVSDWRRSASCAEICTHLLHIQTDGVKFRDIVLRTIQADFKNKEVLRSESPDRYLSCVAFLCQIFLRMRDEKGHVIVFMVTPVMDSLELLLDNKASDDELNCAATQLLKIGPLLHQYGDKARLDRLRPTLREKILDNCGSRETRLLMVNILENFAAEWTLH